MGDDSNSPAPAEAGTDGLQGHPLPGAPSQFTCPECGGAIWELHDGHLIRFRCHVGHAYSADSFLAEKTVALEGALWGALRSLKENAALARRDVSRGVAVG